MNYRFSISPEQKLNDPTFKKYAELLADKYFLESNETDIFEFIGKRVINLM